MIFRADSDKPHRCPACWTIPDLIWERHGHARRWCVYTCRYGHRFTRIPLLGCRVGGLLVGTKEHLLRLSRRGWLDAARGRGQAVSDAVYRDHAGIERYWVILSPRRASDGRSVCAECREVEDVEST